MLRNSFAEPYPNPGNCSQLSFLLPEKGEMILRDQYCFPKMRTWCYPSAQKTALSKTEAWVLCSNFTDSQVRKYTTKAERSVTYAFEVLRNVSSHWGTEDSTTPPPLIFLHATALTIVPNNFFMNNSARLQQVLWQQIWCLFHCLFYFSNHGHLISTLLISSVVPCSLLCCPKYSPLSLTFQFLTISTTCSVREFFMALHSC